MKYLLSLLLLFVCFNSNAIPIQGNIQASHDYPEFVKDVTVSLYKKVGRSNSIEVVCSGSFISRNQVLTAAHCFDDKNYNVYVMHGHKLHAASKVKIHNKYMRRDIYDDHWGILERVELENDIAIIELEKKVKVKNVANIARDVAPLADHSLISFSGFGHSAYIFGMGDGSGSLRVSIPYKISSQEKNKFSVQYGASSACYGDSGGPAWLLHADGSYEQIGVISMADCAVMTWGQRISESIIKSDDYNTYGSFK